VLQQEFSRRPDACSNTYVLRLEIRMRVVSVVAPTWKNGLLVLLVKCIDVVGVRVVGSNDEVVVRLCRH